ncbi:phenylalanine--tRNA ligase subunit beta [Harryflintia acetispora]|uniref:phenylalanine--tRNA ligase subunit beta n=1 Tax=Harryflintia acetispora TaxID=1849041 RepID=UPI00189A2374|nr:phenylalanine--tRNA ligase subunit beta [Harryflintia acetispora]
MNLSMKWLSDYVKIDAPIHDFCEAMTMSGSKVEGYTVEGSEISKVVVGKVLSVEKHPNADSLVVCMLDVAQEQPIQIVTGADNVVPGALVPVALDGSTLPHGVKIRKGKLRGELSNGMMCSLPELALTLHDFPYGTEEGIFLLGEDCEGKPGDDIRPVIGLDDTCVEFEITSNRPDCLSVLGLAREAAATYKVPFVAPQPKVQKETDDIKNLLSVEVQSPELCPRYVARMVKNVKIGPSPRWMRERLRASGVRPINNIVDITNYVMLEYGQPMHAFDYKYVKDGKIIARNARPGETLTTLDGIERKLDEQMLVIADSEKPSAVAGVMGGEYSGIADDTEMIVFESACFKGSSIRTTSKKLGLRTESSSRFEKGLDPETCIPAVQRACELVELLGAGEVVGGMIDVDNADHTPRTLPLTPEWINEFLGIEIPTGEMENILRAIDFKVENGIITVPSFRADIETKADVAEEIARFYGYNNIPTTTLRGSAQGHLTERQKFEGVVSRTLLAQGLSEIITYSFISPKYYDKICLPAQCKERDSLKILNPLGEDTSVMRTTTLPSMLETLSRNYNNRNQSALLFEIGTEYTPTGDDQLPVEKKQITLGCYQDGYDFFAIKGAVETLLEALDVKDYDFVQKEDDPSFHPGRCAEILVGGQVCGVIGEVHPRVCLNYEIGTRVYAAKLDVDLLYENRDHEKTFVPLPKFPASSRDLALICDEGMPVATLEKTIRASVGGVLESVKLFDVYQGAQIERGKKSVAYSISMRAQDRTLTDEEADAAVKRTLKALSQLGVTLRA